MQTPRPIICAVEKQPGKRMIVEKYKIEVVAQPPAYNHFSEKVWAVHGQAVGCRKTQPGTNVSGGVNHVARLSVSVCYKREFHYYLGWIK